MKNIANSNDIDKNIKELEKLAEKVLQLKNTSIPRRPIVIEFCGSPKSGKSSSINSLDLFLRRNSFRTKVLTERASVCPIKKKYDPYFNIWTACMAIASLSEILSNNPKDYDVIILDRGIFDAICWFNWLLKRNHFDNDNFESIINFLSMKRWRAIIDLIYVFSATPAVSLEREYAHLLTRKMGSIMHPDILESYNETITDCIKKYSTIFKKVEHIDTSEKGINEVNHEVTKHILEILKINTSEKIGYFDIKDININLPVSFNVDEFICQETKINFAPRPNVEYDQQKIQPIPIVVITNKKRDKVLVVKKNKKQTSENSPESDRLLLYLGGHAREEDVIQTSKKDTLSVLKYSLQRELKEETGIDFYPENNATFCIWSRTNERSKLHLAICYILEVDFERTKISLDKNEFITTGNTKSGKVQNIKELSKIYNKLEDWSQIILKKIFQITPDAEERFLFEK